jgi:hypothetical protein
VPYSESEQENLQLSAMTICNTRVAYNGKFFVIGLVSDMQSKIGVFAFQKETFNT